MDATHSKTCNGVPFTVHHNSDWSGEAIVVYGDNATEVRLPGTVLIALAHDAVLDQVRSRLVAYAEDFDIDD